MSSESNHLPVVVGVDGSEQSKSALGWAARYARATSAPLRVVIAWYLPNNYDWSVPLPDPWDPESDARKVLEDEMAEVLGAAAPDLELSTSVVEGHPAQVLTEASKQASLVVVGSRGRGQFSGMLLGSVSGFLTTHARCPVVVMRGASEAQ